MLKVDLGLLNREGSVSFAASVAADDGLWSETRIRWASDVDVQLEATLAGTGQVVVRGRVRGALHLECTRCLQPVESQFGGGLTLVFQSEESETDDEDTGAYLLDPKGSELDVSEAVREEVILAMNPYAVCKPDCQGLCPMCGTNLNEGSCDCTEDEVDPRWGALRNLKSE